jgi:hypothetical protein
MPIIFQEFSRKEPDTHRSDTAILQTEYYSNFCPKKQKFCLEIGS